MVNRNFLDLEIPDPNNRNPHVSDILDKVYECIHEHLDSGNRRDACL